MQSGILGAALFVLAAAGFGQTEVVPRQVAAPPEDVTSGRVRLPDPEQSATRSGAAWLAVVLAPNSSGGFAWEGEVPVSASGPVALALLGEDALAWRLALAPRGGEPRPLEEWLARPGVDHRSGVELGVGAQRVEFAAAPAGMWRVRVEADRPSFGWLAVRDGGSVTIASHATTWSTLAGTDIGIVVAVQDPDDEPGHDASIERAELVLGFAAAEVRELMLDDGRHDDGLAGDGVFGAFLPPGLLGEVRFRVEVHGTTAGGAAFLRTTHHALDVLPRNVALSGTASASLEGPLRARIGVGVEDPSSAVLPRLHVSAEIWGTSNAGSLIPVCWLSRITHAEQGASGWELPLALDARWVELAGARAPYELREVRVQDIDSNVVLDRIATLPLGELPLPPRTWVVPAVPTWDMLAAAAAMPIVPRSTTRGLLLSHGYCSGAGIWPPADFTQPKREFHDPDADRTNDEFAQVMLAQTSDLGSFGVVGHSQGGLAALQLYAYYVSGLDYASGPRRIQSVASPYQGTPLAAFAATCGTHNDLTPEEAALWLSTIPSWARAEVYYWTVSNSGSACNFFTDFLLTDPDDGVIERSRGALPGGNAMGHVTGWCHTTGMTNPACYTDHARNHDMNLNAAR